MTQKKNFCTVVVVVLQMKLQFFVLRIRAYAVYISVPWVEASSEALVFVGEQVFSRCWLLPPPLSPPSPLCAKTHARYGCYSRFALARRVEGRCAVVVSLGVVGKKEYWPAPHTVAVMLAMQKFFAIFLRSSGARALPFIPSFQVGLGSFKFFSLRAHLAPFSLVWWYTFFEGADVYIYTHTYKYG